MSEFLKAAGENLRSRAFALASVMVDWRVARDAASEVNLLPLLADKNQLSCDIGAGRGLFSFWMLHLGLRVAAFEANPRMIRILRHRFPRALREGRLRILKDDVAQCRLDDLITEPVGFIRIAAAGHEPRVLEGARGLLVEHRPSILVEAEERQRPGSVALARRMLDPLGYEGFFIDADGLHPIDDFDPDVHRRRDALNAARPGRASVNNFIFIARPHMKARLQGWRPHRALTGI